MSKAGLSETKKYVVARKRLIAQWWPRSCVTAFANNRSTSELVGLEESIGSGSAACAFCLSLMPKDLPDVAGLVAGLQDLQDTLDIVAVLDQAVYHQYNTQRRVDCCWSNSRIRRVGRLEDQLVDLEEGLQRRDRLDRERLERLRALMPTVTRHQRKPKELKCALTLLERGLWDEDEGQFSGIFTPMMTVIR